MSLSPDSADFQEFLLTSYLPSSLPAPISNLLQHLPVPEVVMAMHIEMKAPNYPAETKVQLLLVLGRVRGRARSQQDLGFAYTINKTAGSIKKNTVEYIITSLINTKIN